MDNKINLRELVLGILLEVTKDGEYSHIAIRNTLDKYQYLEKQERSFIKRVCEGTLEHMIWIDYVINQFSKVKVNKMKPVIRCILRSSVYELQFMDAIPVSATCNEAVKLAQKKGFHNLKGFVNGVLRNISRNLDHILLPDREQEPMTYFSVKYSMPLWILEMWSKTYSMEQIERFLEAFLTETPTSIRVNTASTTKQALIEELEEAQIHVMDNAELPNALYIDNYDSLGRIPAFAEGKFYVQDVSSMQVSLWADPQPGNYVIDVCAAPGGKSIHMAELMMEKSASCCKEPALEAETGKVPGKEETVLTSETETKAVPAMGMVEARDLTEYKVALIQENIERCQLPNIHAVQADARILEEEKIEQADIVIADLPCSGLGVIGKKSDIKYKMTEETCRELSKLQKEILHTVQHYVKPGGILMYSTCTINPEENEENVTWFLKEHAEFSLEKKQQILPQKGRNDGFFLAKLVKVRI